MTLQEAISDAWRIYTTALEEHNPSHVFLLTSGGNDSIVPLHLLHKHASVTAAMHIDTGIRIPEVEDHVRGTCEAMNLRLLVYRASENTKADGTPDPMHYTDIVHEHGFPGPAQHGRMYAMLKERQVRRLIRDHQPGNRNIMLITGVRRSESRRRMGTVEEIQRAGRTVWVAPVTNWDDDHMRTYRDLHKLPESDVARKLGMSGECLCGAYAQPGELATIERHYPDTAAHIHNLQRGKPWGWEDTPPQAWFQYQAGQEFLGEEFMPLCVGCTKKWRTFQEAT